jgi:hypothetical protein
VRGDRRYLTGLIDAVDATLDDLEHLHLEDHRRVPVAYASRLDRLSARLPAEVRSELRTGIPITSLMETLYTIQGRLMTFRSAWTGNLVREDSPARGPVGGFRCSAFL